MASLWNIVQILWKKQRFIVSALTAYCAIALLYYIALTNLRDSNTVTLKTEFRVGGFLRQPTVSFKQYEARNISGPGLGPWLRNHPRLREQNLKLPKCPPDLKLNGDDATVEKLTNCVKDKNSLMFPPNMESWRYSKKAFCDGAFVIFHGEAALLQDVVVNFTATKGLCSEAEFQEGGDERTPITGFFQLDKKPNCDASSLSHGFRGGTSHLMDWAEAISAHSEGSTTSKSDRFTIAVKRYEHHNIYHTMSDVYNAFVVARFFGLSPKSVDILFIDGKSSPKTKMLPLWKTLFNSVSLMCQLTGPTHFYPALFWNKLGYESILLDYTNVELPLAEDFHYYVLHSFKIRHKPLDCFRLLNVLLISRGNYMNRTISRQIANEKEILYAINNNQTLSAKAQWVRLEHLDISAQLRLVANSDIIVGMHGAGLTLTLFAPPHAGLIEFKPKYFTAASHHFEGVARWRHLHYIRWDEPNTSNEAVPGVSSALPVDIVTDSVLNMRKMICGPISIHSPTG